MVLRFSFEFWLSCVGLHGFRFVILVGCIVYCSRAFVVGVFGDTLFCLGYYVSVTGFDLLFGGCFSFAVYYGFAFLFGCLLFVGFVLVCLLHVFCFFGLFGVWVLVLLSGFVLCYCDADVCCLGIRFVWCFYVLFVFTLMLCCLFVFCCSLNCFVLGNAWCLWFVICVCD